MAYDPAHDAQRLHKAMKGLGTDEAAIIDVLGKRPSHQRAAITQHYKAQYGSDLKADLKSEISGNFLKTCKGLCVFLAEHDANVLRKAIKGAGTDEQTLIETLIPKSNQQIHAIKEAYKKLHKNDLESDIKGDTSGNFCRVLVAILQCLREEAPNPQLVQQDAEELFKAGEKVMGTDEDTFNRILCHRAFPHIKLVAEAYKAKHGKTLEVAVKGETSGSYEDALVAIVKFSVDPAVFYAEVFHDAMQGLGTNDRRLQRVCITQMEGNMTAIKQAFLAKYKKNLGDFIRDDTSGDYRKLLLTLIGEK